MEEKKKMRVLNRLVKRYQKDMDPQFSKKTKSKKRIKAFKRGAQAFYEKRPQSRNPYTKDKLKHLFNLFNLGYFYAELDKETTKNHFRKMFGRG
jgi:hypothetical protein